MFPLSSRPTSDLVLARNNSGVVYARYDSFTLALLSRFCLLHSFPLVSYSYPTRTASPGANYIGTTAHIPALRDACAYVVLSKIRTSPPSPPYSIRCRQRPLSPPSASNLTRIHPAPRRSAANFLSIQSHLPHIPNVGALPTLERVHSIWTPVHAVGPAAPRSCAALAALGGCPIEREDVRRLGVRAPRCLARADTECRPPLPLRVYPCVLRASTSLRPDLPDLPMLDILTLD
ncbi:hypothetical protein C8J57DRAFT_1522925 [Mycena rebaudengoi]|nr:hypothetical protein C8J57DRAFT_1522925 [Mycena rebaudengoi]